MKWDELVGYSIVALYGMMGSAWLLLHATRSQAVATLIVCFFLKHKLKG